jgi:hypothetical protein
MESYANLNKKLLIDDIKFIALHELIFSKNLPKTISIFNLSINCKEKIEGKNTKIINK